MSKEHQTRTLIRRNRVPSRGFRRRSPSSTLVLRIVAVAVAISAFGTASLRADAPQARVAPTSTSQRAAVGASTVDPVAAYNRRSPITQNERNFTKTFATPGGEDAALVGRYLSRLLPEDLRAQTSWRYDERENTLTVYGPRASIEAADRIIAQFDKQLFDSLAAAGQSADFVGAAGIVDVRRPVYSERADARPTASSANYEETPSRYYDPERNRYVGVAYQAEGAILPPPQDEAPIFGAETSAPVPTPVASLADAAASRDPAATSDDFALEIVSYRVSPAQIDRVEELARRRFASNPEIAFSVDRQTGKLVVHTNRKWRRAVDAYFAAGNVFPIDSASPAAAAFDPRLATGTTRRLDGVDTTEPLGVRATRQALGGPTANASNAVAAPFASPTLAGRVSDVYAPRYRAASEIKGAMIQLFGARFQRTASADASAQYSERQVENYRFVKRPTQGETASRSCDLSFDALGNRIALQGDAAICAQMLVLLRAMDQAPLRNGNVRRFIPIENGDSRKLRQIFEYGATSRNVGPLGFDARDPFELGSELARAGLDRYFDKSNKLGAFGTFENAFAADESSENVALASSLQKRSNATRSIAQIAYQDADLGALGDGGLGADLGGFDAQFGDFSGRRGGGPGGVGVVQDFVPTVLDNLDVVIVDNATDAEFERIKQMIEQIEELAKIADPIVEVYNLKHVDGAMLHGVLTKLYQEMFTSKQGRVMFYALQNPNALLVVGWGQAFTDMKNLIEVFDQPIADGAGTMRVVRLQYASASEIAASLTETFVRPAADGTGGLAPRIRAFADVRTNSLVVQASPNDWLEIQKILIDLDVNKVGTKLTTRVFPLKNSLAENIRTTIMEAILPAKQGTLDTTAAKFPMLELLSVDETGRKLVESGVMMDVDVVADAYHNQLIVNAPADCMPFMEKLIELLDVAPKKAQIRFFQVRNGDASQIMMTLQSLLATSDENLSTPTLPQADGEETFVPVRFALDTRTNVIIAAAAPKELAIVDALIVALDVKDEQERVEEVVQLRNIQALVVAEAIDDYLAQKQALETASEALSNYQLYESQIIVIPESISNSIIVSAAPEYMEKILEMIKTFDKDPPQVVIQVLIAEVTLTDQEEFGIEAGFQDSVSFDRSLITSTGSNATGTPGFDIVGSNGPGQNLNANVPTTDIGGQVLNNFGLGTSSSSLGYGGFVVSANSRSVDVTLRALREKNRLQVLSRPQVTAMDNQQAFILVGQRVPRIDGTTTTNYGVQMNTTDTPVGLILLVTPRVADDGRIIMEIGAEKSSLGNDADAVPIYSQDGQVIKSQSIDTIQTLTAISARDGETVMLGGLLTSSKEKISRGVPYLSDIPLLGRLFRFDQEIETRKELLIVMTPRIMRDDADFAEVKRVETGKMSWDLDAAMELNGDMGLYDVRTGRGAAPKKTKRLVQDLIAPDPMNELDKIPPYSPSRDYAPRSQAPQTAPSTPRNGSNVGNAESGGNVGVGSDEFKLEYDSENALESGDLGYAPDANASRTRSFAEYRRAESDERGAELESLESLPRLENARAAALTWTADSSVRRR